MTPESAYDIFFDAVLGVQGVILFFCLIRSIIGPSVADRIVAVNMTGTVVMVIIAVLAGMLREGYLADVELIYAMLSFLAVVLLTKVYMGAINEKRIREQEKEAGGDV